MGTLTKATPIRKMVDWVFVMVFIQSFSRLVVGVPQCLDGYNRDPNSHKCWKFDATVRTWIDALTKCREDGAELGRLDNQEDHNFVRTIQPKIAWIGVNDREIDYQYVDSVGNHLTWLNWKHPQEESTDVGKHCFYMAQNNNGKWLGAECADQRGYICMAEQQDSIFHLTSGALLYSDLVTVNDVILSQCSVHCLNNHQCLAFAFKDTVCRLLRYSGAQADFSGWDVYVG